jgi:hypothetical protein
VKEDELFSAASPQFTMNVLIFTVVVCYICVCNSFLLSSSRMHAPGMRMVATSSPASTASTFSVDMTDLPSLKYQILQMGASLDRGQSYNPTSGDQYSERMQVAKDRILAMVDAFPQVPKSLEEIDGEWELVLTTVPHGIFRSSPFFLAIQDAYASVGQPEKANLFFKLHELQTCSWGASKIGRVAQYIDSTNNTLISEFDTSIFSLTVVPIIGWGKMLPTFGGCVVTVSSANMTEDGTIDMEVQYTTGKPVPGLKGLSENIWGVKVPVGRVWKVLPWNKGRPAKCTIKTRFADKDFRVMEDSDGELFVYTRPVCPRA